MRSLLFRLAAVALGCVVAVVVGEVSVRLFSGLRVPEPMTVDTTMNLHQRDDLLGWALRPGAADVFQGVDARVNSLGCRGPELTGEGPIVVALGDSITFGAGVEEGASFVGQLGERFAGEARILGCGVSGWNLEQMMLRYDRDLAQLGPKVVVVNLFLDDTSPRYVLDDRSVSSWLRLRSAAYRRAEMSRLWPRPGNRPLPTWALTSEEYQQRIEERFEGWVGQLVGDGIQVVAVVHPFLGPRGPGFGNSAEDAAERARRKGASVIVLRPLYERATRGTIESLSIAPHDFDPHPTRAGHTIVADELERELRRGPHVSAASSAAPGPE